MTKDNIELKTKKFEQVVEVKDSSDNKKTKKFKVKIKEGQDHKIQGAEEVKRDTIEDIKFDAYILEIAEDKDKEKDVEKNGEKVEAIVTYKKGRWWPYFEIKKVGTHEVNEPKKATLAVKGHKYWWPTLTLIIGGSIIGVVLTGVLIWSLLKKDNSSEE
ncbi:MAG: hypothetical protein I3273_03110 [Candidatus Moeniiplasma glomeromycotorum]|nr:hypothetical protein [Candidatus Moeniiplasma glomeromycotorum]MCE8167553.1 hypothetical protein [Candidatus Moeniiplasma glomeromycotorum]MCE8169095.1 hypothetical protein [Candidatus Moeniiplasma glomeromycotorum]